jgi:hypothetical protein
MTELADNSQQSYVMIVSDFSLTICSGANFDYKTSGIYWINLTLRSLGQCKDNNTIQNILNAKFFRKFGDTIQLYDSSINLLLSGSYLSSQSNIPSVPFTVSTIIKPLISSGFTQGVYYILLLYQRNLGRVQVSLNSSNISLKLCS